MQKSEPTAPATRGIKLRRMSRHQRTGILENHRPRNIGPCRPAPQLPVDEVADAPEHQSQRHKRRHKIGHIKKSFAFDAGKRTDRQDGTDDAAVRTHTALPHLEDVQGMRQVPLRLVEKTKTQTSAENDPEHAVKENVFHIVGGHLTPRILRAQPSQRPEEGKS